MKARRVDPAICRALNLWEFIFDPTDSGPEDWTRQGKQIHRSVESLGAVGSVLRDRFVEAQDHGHDARGGGEFGERERGIDRRGADPEEPRPRPIFARKSRREWNCS